MAAVQRHVRRGGFADRSGDSGRDDTTLFRGTRYVRRTHEGGAKARIVNEPFPLTWVRRYTGHWKVECECGYKSQEYKSRLLADEDANLHNRAHLREAYGPKELPR